MEQIVLREPLVLPPQPEDIADDGVGVNSFIYRGEQLDEIQEMFGRTGCCLKIFRNREKFTLNPKKSWWGPSHPEKGSTLTEATHIQNIFAFCGLAARVYTLFVVKINGRKHWVQLTDDLGHMVLTPDIKQQEVIEKMKAIANDYHIQIFNDGRDSNVLQEKYIDFQGFHLPENYEEELKQRLIGIAAVGRWGPWQNYQFIPKLGIVGGRNMKHRIGRLGLHQIDFEGKTVLDIGCSEGMFCQFAIQRGAKQVVGIDLPEVVKPARELASYLGYYNIDFHGYDLLKEIPDMGTFDIVLYLSMCQHIGFPDWVRKATKELLVFEGNGKDEDTPALSKMAEQFQSIEYKGKTEDLFKRPVVWAYR